MRLTAHYSNLLQKKRGISGGLQLQVSYKNTKISKPKLYICRESKILLLVRSTHSVLEIQYCAEINTF